MPQIQRYPNTPAPQATSKSGLFFAALVLVFSIAAGIPIAIGLTKPKPTNPSNANSNAPSVTPQTADLQNKVAEGYTRYRNEAGKFSIDYPKHWTRQGSKVERFSGPDGYFQVQLVPGSIGTIDKVAELEKTKKEMPYGSTPEIVEAKLAGNAARLVRPSNDQPEAFAGTALLLVTLPKPQTFEGTEYPYLALWADMDHLQALAESLKFE